MTSSPTPPSHPVRAALSRRRFMGGAALLSSTAFPPGRTAQGRSSQPSQRARRAWQKEDPAHYRPRFFNDEEYLFLCHACERIFPQDEHGPGARALGVPRFIDRQMDTPYGNGALWYLRPPFMEGPPELGYQLPYSPRELYRRAITPINTWCLMAHNALFAALPGHEQDDVLRKLENDTLRFNDIPGATFFEQLRTNTLEGAFADPVYGGNHQMAGWQMMGFPGARADFMDWVNQGGESYPLGPVGMPARPDPYSPAMLAEEGG